MERMEKSVHAFFYQKMSDVLNIDPEETAKNQQTINVLRNKLELLNHITSNLDENKPLSLATVAMIEQVLLFSNFAMLKSFKSNGNNLIKNTLTGVDFVIQDEQIHGELAKGLFLNYVQENSKYALYDLSELPSQIIAVMEEIIAHEDAVIDYTFPGNIAINDITGEQLKTFIRSRANWVLNSIGFDDFYLITSNPIGDWFYQGTKGIKSHDFFASGTSQYRRSWKFENFSRKPFIKGVSDE
jgi:ribonucleotide reductase beta subunit family protein with ferritin-like domain